MVHSNTGNTELDELLCDNQILYRSKCEMANCINNSDPNKKKLYFSFPQYDYFCSKWTFACARPDLVDLYLKKGSMFFYKTRKVCEEHFVQNDFKNPALLRQGLQTNAVPTRNLPELRTIINIVSNLKNYNINNNDDPITPIPVMAHFGLKRSLRIRKSKQKLAKSIKSKDTKNKKSILLKRQLSKRGRRKQIKN